MSVQVCVALLAFLSLTAASEPECEELTKQLENRTKLHGKWIMYAQRSNCEYFMMEFTNNTSSWLELTPLPNSEDMTLRYGDRIYGTCDVGSTNATFDGNVTKSVFYYNSSYNVQFSRQFETCPDCMMCVGETVKNGRKCTKVVFHSRTGNLTDSQQEVFKKQMECHNIPQDFAFGTTSDLCPDEKEAATEVKKDGQ